MEAGAGTLLRLQEGQVDRVLIVAEPTAKSIEAARRMAEIAAERTRVLVIANRVRDATDLERIQAVLGDHELVQIPDDPEILRADERGLAPFDASPDAPAVQALKRLAADLAGSN